ncbi:MAG: DUF2179 domain-containing protein [Proteobacteria bacterium]|nr:DUF2179 domain-containing protein [Pseudomonadota bacterium]MBU1138422.1 DUF2179 domain-containing protein [Pseudomonadota bacterium]MBU1231396.1 DUF2179 domain-containing protein [Pseudomonadota bacterium]MBU1418493.1 DUF2179 domain-containing protein [Pseudomonadota bacterium]MBU1455002.1 DUF2179 domain-containing protein [Pseudomonadota bacterium]
MVSITESSSFVFVIIPLLIFFARILDVSIGTLRIIFVSKGLKYYAALLGFFESLIWLLAVAQVMQNLNSWQTYVAFAFGFAAGNYVGVVLEEKIALGKMLIRVITRREADDLVKVLWEEGYGVTSVDAQGESGPVKLIFSIAKRKNITKIISIIKKYNPNAFYTIEDMRYVNETYPLPLPLTKRGLFPHLILRKRK